MFKRQICPICKTGLRMLELDRREPVCPYMGCHNGKKCSRFRRIETGKKDGILSRFIKFSKVLPPPKNSPVRAF